MPREVSFPELLYPRDVVEQQLGRDADGNLSRLVDATFFASLEREETKSGHFRIAYHPDGLNGLKRLEQAIRVGDARSTTPAWYPLRLNVARSVSSFSIHNIAKMASMTRLPRTAIVVGASDGTLRIEGIARRIEREPNQRIPGEDDVLVCTSRKPGQVILSKHGEPILWYESGQALHWTNANELENLLHKKESIVHRALLRTCVKSVHKTTLNVLEESPFYLIGRALSEIVRTMRDARHGGMLAVVPIGHRKRLQTGGKYKLPKESRALLGSYLARTAEHQARAAKTEVRRPNEQPLEGTLSEKFGQISYDVLHEFSLNIGMLTTVDNALILGPDLEVICAGYQVAKRKVGPPVMELSTLNGSGRATSFPLVRHGSRHRAAADFAYTFPESVVFVLSEDGNLRCLHRPRRHPAVLLWNVLERVDL